MSSEQDPEPFLREVLSLPPGSREPSPPPPPNSRVGGDPRYRMRKGSEWAKGESIQLLRRHEIHQSLIYAVTFEDQTGLAWASFCYLEQDERGFWHLTGYAGSNKEGVRRSLKSAPWVRLIGGSGGESLWAGGYITEKAPDAHLVRLICKNGPVLEDIAQDGIVLFQTRQHVELPVQVEVYTRSNKLIGTQSFLDYVTA